MTLTCLWDFTLKTNASTLEFREPCENFWVFAEWLILEESFCKDPEVLTSGQIDLTPPRLLIDGQWLCGSVHQDVMPRLHRHLSLSQDNVLLCYKRSQHIKELRGTLIQTFQFPLPIQEPPHLRHYQFLPKLLLLCCHKLTVKNRLFVPTVKVQNLIVQAPAWVHSNPFWILEGVSQQTHQTEF